MMNTTMAIRNEYSEKYDWWLNGAGIIRYQPKDIK